MTERRVTVGPVRNGNGLIAARSFRRNERIIKLAGRVVHYRLLWARRGPFADNCIRFGPETYLDPGEQYGRYLNHCCEPNAGIRKEMSQLFLFAARPIRRGEEVAIDYSTTIGDDDVWTMRCNCGCTSCRKRIRRFGALPAALQAEYLERGLVPPFIRRTLE